jgi:cysteinyl-tRNA synthetase
MDIFLFNTLTNKKEKFEPINKGHVSMYNCGPTVYHYAHIGNLRSYIMADTLRRMFEYNALEVKQIINITDVGHLVTDADEGEDKMEKGAKREGKSVKEIAQFYTDAFLEDLKMLNVKTVGTFFPKATENIPEQITLIEKLETLGYTYQTSDGIYFDTAKFENYGKLGNINIKGLREGARVVAIISR